KSIDKIKSDKNKLFRIMKDTIDAAQIPNYLGLIMASQMHKLNLGQTIEEFPNPKCRSVFLSTNEHSKFMRVIYDPFIMLDAHWTEKQVQRSDLHLGFWIF